MADLIWWAQISQGRVLGDNDQFQVDVRDDTPGRFRVQLRTSFDIEWWKGIFLYRGDWVIGASETERYDRVGSIIDIETPTSETIDIYQLELAKAKMFGIHTGVYRLPVEDINGGAINSKLIVFTWLRD
jgi:hypothetical protein